MLPRTPRSPLSRAALALGAGLAFTLIAPVLAPAATGLVPTAMAQQPQPSQFQAILSAYGTFQAHDRYGEVWVPSQTTVPEGWHPYPACNWVHSKDLGWYFNDKTEWGKIVHHYGRWAHDKTLGWVWVKGEEFSPGWVVWRTSDTWVGWAPMPPEQDVKEISATEFNTDKHWTFMDAKTFGRGCDGTTYASQPATPAIFTQTRLVTDVRFVNGIAVFVLPPPLIINIVDIDVGIFPPWNPCFFGAWFWNWNMLVNNVVINININNGPQCPVVPVQKMMKPIPIISTPPPPPGAAPKPDRRVDLPPPSRPLDPPTSGKPDRTIPPVVILPERPTLPPVVKPDRPRLPPVVILPERPNKPDRPTKPNRPSETKPTKPGIPPIVRPDFPRKPPVIVDVPRRPSKPEVIRTAPKFQDIARVPQRVPVPKLERSADSFKHRAPALNRGPVIR